MHHHAAGQKGNNAVMRLIAAIVRTREIFFSVSGPTIFLIKSVIKTSTTKNDDERKRTRVERSCCNH